MPNGNWESLLSTRPKVCADALVGPRRSQRSNKAWVEVYRGLGHGPCKDSCTKANSIGFPDEIQDFADNFVQLQDARERADYDPTFKLTQEQAKVFVSWAEQSIVSLNQVSAIDKTAFAAWVLITTRGAVHARKLSKEALSAAE